jgi:branched-subunit amino acid aminotransferase/4-amino-4-deoxychorismate lyase
MAVFESIRVLPGRLCFWEEHFALLAQTAAGLGWALDSSAGTAAAALLLDQKLEPSGEAFARLYLTAGDGAPSAPVDAPRLLLFWEPRQRLLPESYSVIECAEPHIPAPGGMKTASYWGNLRALQSALSRNAQETLLFNASGHLTGAAMANVFLRKNGAWCTPPISSGARRGVIRQWVLKNLSVTEAPLSRADCRSADALFLTNSWLGILPVHSLDGARKEVPGAVRVLSETFEKCATGCLSAFL